MYVFSCIYIYRVLFLQYCRWWKQPCMETPKFGPDPWHSTRVQPAVKTKLSQLVGCSICLAEGIGFVSHTLSGDINYLYTCSSVLGWTRTQICQAILCLPTTSCNFKGFFSTGNLCIWAKAVVSTISAHQVTSMKLLEHQAVPGSLKVQQMRWIGDLSGLQIYLDGYLYLPVYVSWSVSVSVFVSVHL